MNRPPHKIVLNLTRNLDQVVREVMDHHQTVAVDSVAGSDPGTAMLRNSGMAIIDDGSLRVVLQWVFRKHWRAEIPDYKPGTTLAFDFYESASHKYWLRGLIRRCR